MKLANRMFMVVLAVIMLMSIMVFPASAAETRSTTDRKYQFEVVPTTDFAYTEKAVKDNDSKLFTRVDTMTDEFVRVAAFSMDTSEGIPINLTYYGGGIVPYVRCNKGINYSIGSVIYEYYKKYPTTYGNTGGLGFQSALVNRSDTISGWWSVDSGSTHNTPLAP